MQNTSYKMPDWMKHKLKSRLLGDISITSDTQMTPPYGRQWSGTKEPLDEIERGEWKRWLGFRMGSTCIPVADSFWYLAKLKQFVKFKNKIKKKKKEKEKSVRSVSTKMHNRKIFFLAQCINAIYMQSFSCGDWLHCLFANNSDVYSSLSSVFYSSLFL